MVFDNGAALPASTAGGWGTSGGGDVIAFVDDDTLVGYTNSLSSFDLTVMDVDVRGVHVVPLVRAAQLVATRVSWPAAGTFTLTAAA